MLVTCRAKASFMCCYIVMRPSCCIHCSPSWPGL